MRHVPLLLLLLALPALGQQDPKRLPAKDRPLQERINEAIDRGVAWLKDAGSPNGLHQSQFGAGGATALALYTLAASGVPADDAEVKKIVKALRKLPVARGTAAGLMSDPPALRMTYTHSLLVLALCTLDPVAYKKEIKRSIAVLVKAQKPSGQWAYIVSMGGPLDGGDNSNTQFALLALRIAALKGFRIPAAVWKRTLAHFEKTAERTGGWGYGCRGSITGTYGSMTAVGLASVVICRAMLLGEEKAAAHDYLGEPAIARGMVWLEENIAFDLHPGIADVGIPAGAGAPPGAMNIPPQAFQYYWLYSVERVGMLLGRRHIGTHEWYREGAEWLLAEQKKDGSWANAAHGMMAPEPPLAATCFALLFLKKATIPVVTPPPVERK